ncbi:NAD(P)-dependent oxidoreductase [Actinoplanes sp. N902-109]|uniref:NAD(P)-dependent oxidoreductase n=1 Tax=Actinoplanes sp. (strain N902-109) TaxID=649831 RepID=UPI0003294456|nr:NAD(P)-dependent oxidoreductase [Actinoplanes sp. N902-109]AGL18520.1 putative dehydrogenase [Actinoplanes sp. N902-109]
MTVVGIVSPGYMGAGLGSALRAGGARVVTTVAGRSARSQRLATAAGLELLPDLAAVLGTAEVVLSVVPPGQAVATARAIAAARPAGAAPLIADLNAIAPPTLATVAEVLAGAAVVDGSISGPPPTARPGARVYLSGPRAAEVAALPWAGQVEPVVLGGRLGTASALKMCTASVYKGLTALVTQAMRAAGHYGVLDEVLADLARADLDGSAGVPRAATKAHRFVDEMREIAVAQAGAGLTPDLFAAMAAVYADVAGTALADGDPESTGGLPPAETVARLATAAGSASPGAPDAPQSRR